MFYRHKASGPQGWPGRWTGLLILLLALAGVAPAPARAQTTLNSAARGWYDGTGFHKPGNGNYVVGQAAGKRYHNFFVFDLTPVTQRVVSATLRIYNPNDLRRRGYDSEDATETYALFDVLVPASTLTTGAVSGSERGQAIHQDLSGGTSYGARTVSAADNGAFVEIPLNAAAVAAINASRGAKFAIGGAITTVERSGSAPREQVFCFSSSDPADGNVQLQLTSSRPQLSGKPSRDRYDR